jgi:hypothetical protein
MRGAGDEDIRKRARVGGPEHFEVDVAAGGGIVE